MSSRYCIYALTLLFLNPAPDQQKDISKEIARCATLKGDLERLECYDALARSLGLDKPQTLPTSVEGIGKWEIQEEINPIDDSKTVILKLMAESGVSVWGKSVLLFLLCRSNETDVIIRWNDYLGSESATVISRLGNQKAETKAWNLSTDHEATFYRGDTISFVKRLLDVRRLVVQTTPYN